jgi:hypothetical protein
LLGVSCKAIFAVIIENIMPLLINIGHKWNLSVWSYKMSLVFSQEGFQNGMQKPKL